MFPWDRFEMRMVGVLPVQVRTSMHIDLFRGCAVSIMTSILLFIPVILGRLGASAEVIASYYSAGYLGVFSTGVCLWLMRKWGMRVVSLASWTVGRFVLFVGAFVTSAVGIAIVGTLHSFLEQWVEAVKPKLLEHLYPVQLRGRIMAFVQLVSACVIVFITPVVGFILDRSGHPVLMVVAGGFGLIATLLVSQIMARVGDRVFVVDYESSVFVSGLWRDRAFVLFLISLVLFGVGSLMPVSIYAIVKVGRLGLTFYEIGLLSFVQSGAWVIGLLVGGWLTDRFGGLRCLQGVFLINTMFILPYVWAWNGWMLVPSFIAIGLVSAGMELWVTYTIIELAEPGLLPEYTAVCMMAIGGRGLIAPLIGVGLLRNGVSEPSLLIFGAMLSVCAAIVLFPAMFYQKAAGKVA